MSAPKRPSWGHVSRHCYYCGKVGPFEAIGSVARRALTEDTSNG